MAGRSLGRLHNVVERLSLNDKLREHKHMLGTAMRAQEGLLAELVDDDIENKRTVFFFFVIVIVFVVGND